MDLKTITEVALLLFLPAFNAVKGEATTTLDCMGGGQQGHSTQLVCKITGSLTTGIIFIPPGGRQVVQCNTDNTRCRGSSDYSAVIDSQTQITLTIQSFTDTDVGKWTCQDGVNGNPSTCTKTEIYGPDSVTLSPSSPGTVVEGDTLTVTCTSLCNPTCSYSWSLNNKILSTTSQLTLTHISRQQTGEIYKCTANNPTTSVEKSEQFQLYVYYGPDSVKVNVSSALTAQEGDDVAVLCEADCRTSCSFTWKFKTHTKSTSAVLTLNDVDKSQAGVYTCTAVNTNSNKSNYTTVTLDVLYQTSITSFTLNSNSTKITVDELTNVSLRCEVDSNPASHIKLLNDSHILREVKNSKSVEYSWNEAGCLDTGFYTCEAGNSIKSDVSQSLQLNVTCSPRLDHQVTFQNKFATVEGGNVTLHISVIANPVPTFTWYKLTDVNNKSLGSIQPVLTTNVSAVGEYKLTNVKEEDFGIYQVVVSNGEKRPDLVVKLSVTAEGPPTVPSDVRTWITGPHSVSVSWTEEFNGGSQQTFLVQYRADTTSEWTNLTEQFGEKGLHTNHTAEISSLQPNTRYLIRVLAFNKFGFKTFTKEEEILTQAAKDPESSKIVAVAAGVATVGVVIVAVVVVLLVLFIRRRKQNKTPSDKAVTANHSNQNNSNVLYSVVNKIKRAGTSSSTNRQTNENTVRSEPGAEYALVNKDKNNKNDNKPGPSSSGDLYAVVDKTKKPAAVKKPKMKPKKKKKTNDEKHIYGNDNTAFVEDKKPKKPRKGKTNPATAKRRNERQLVYTEIEFTNEKMSQPIHKKEEPTLYIQIDFSKKAPPLCDDDNQQKTK